MFFCRCVVSCLLGCLFYLALFIVLCVLSMYCSVSLWVRKNGCSWLFGGMYAINQSINQWSWKFYISWPTSLHWFSQQNVPVVHACPGIKTEKLSRLLSYFMRSSTDTYSFFLVHTGYKETPDIMINLLANKAERTEEFRCGPEERHMHGTAASRPRSRYDLQKSTTQRETLWR